MNLSQLNVIARRNVKQHSSIILSVAASVGTLATAYLAGKASIEAADIIRRKEEEYGPHNDPKARLKERMQLVWKLYIPTTASAVATIACIIGANRVEAKKTLAAQAAFAIAQRTYDDYREKVISEIGEHKDRSIRDSIAQEGVLNNPPAIEHIVGDGHVLCKDAYSGRYFKSDVESLKRATNEINKKALAHDYATLSDFYYAIGLPSTSGSSEVGWKSSRLMELIFMAALTDDEKPCIVFEYNYIDLL